MPAFHAKAGRITHNTHKTDKPMKASQKRSYKMPVVVDYGNVVDLTKQGNVQNSDVPNGNSPSAYPPMS